MVDLIWRVLIIGLAATALIDIWAIVLNTFAGIAKPNWAMVGRWFGHLPRGEVFHDDIAKSAPIANELALGWCAHYAVGIAFAAALVFFAGAGWLATPTFLPAWIVGIVTVGFGWFLLQPGLGLGWAASKRPNAMQIRGLNLVSHTIFALGLYGAALLLR